MLGLHIEMGVGCIRISPLSLRRCMVQRYERYEGVGGCQICGEKCYVTLEWPLKV